ncbi:MAG: lactate racemase domain-containing protein [Thermoleophilia bacterium]
MLLAGDDLREVRLPGPVQLVNPPPPLEPLPDFPAAVTAALDMPLGLPPLERLAGRGARVTVAFDDPCLPLPPPLVDPRQVVLRAVVARLTAAGVRREDIALVCANGLHRRWTARELRPIVGATLARRFGDRVECYDAEDPGANVSLGRTESGLVVEVSRRVTDADLVVYVGVPWTEMNGGHKSLACGLATYRCVAQHHRAGVQAASPLMEPESSHMHRCLGEIGRYIGSRVPVFQVETVVNNRLWAGPWRLLDVHRPRVPLLLRPAQRLPGGVRGRLRGALRGFYQPAGVWAGAVEPVHAAVRERLRGARGRAEAAADILVLGLPNLSPYAVHSRMNPLLVANLGLGYAFQFGRGRPLVRPGGYLVLANPCSPGFHREHHAAYARFWDEVLPETRDPSRMETEFEPRFAADPALVGAYRFGYAYHPAHPFFAWYWMARARAHVGGVVVAGAEDVRVVERLGFQAAAGVEEAVTRARAVLGADAVVAVQTIPPVFTVDVAG